MRTAVARDRRSEKEKRIIWRTLAGLALLTVAAGMGWRLAVSRGARPIPANVLLITIDTLRADALGAYGNRAAATPWLDRLASSGLRFDNAHAHNVVTLPSHTNILTGRLPPDHGVRDNAGFRVDSNEDTLATWLKARGFRTAAFVSAFPLDSRFGLDRGFDVYDDRFAERPRGAAMLEPERSAALTVAAARKWLQSQEAAAAWFCWIHLYEPHFPYAPPPPYDSRFARQPYMGEVAAADAALGPVLQPILDAGDSSRTLVIVTSDHGESLGEHEEATHGIFAYESTLKVPLLLYYPPLVEAGSTSRPVAHVDIAPTILDMLQFPAPPPIVGRSLLAEGSGDSGDGRVIYFEALSGLLNRGWAPLRGIVANGFKFIDLPIPELYDVTRDPAESANLASGKPQEVAKFRRMLASFKGRTPTPLEESPEVLGRLRSLGYLTSNSAEVPASFTEQDDPKRLVRFEAELQRANELYLSGKIDEALARSRALVRAQPRMRVALIQLGLLERESGNTGAAVDALQRAVVLNRRDTEAVALLAGTLTEANRPTEAIALLQVYAADDDADTQVLLALALAQARAARIDDALATLDRAGAGDPTNASIFLHAGTVRLIAGQRTEARSAFQRALDLDPNLARAHSSLAAIDAEDGRTDEALSHWRAAVALDPGEYAKLLAVAIALAQTGRAQQARPYMQLFVDSAPADRFPGGIARARQWLASSQMAPTPQQRR